MELSLTNDEIISQLVGRQLLVGCLTVTLGGAYHTLELFFLAGKHFMLIIHADVTSDIFD